MSIAAEGDARRPKLAYGDDRTSTPTDPAGGPPRGVVVVIHGGFWKAAYGPELGGPLAAEPGRAGLGGLEPRVPPGRYRRWLPRPSTTWTAGDRKLADRRRERSTVVTLGHSAGGHLATWAAGSRRAGDACRLARPACSTSPRPTTRVWGAGRSRGSWGRRPRPRTTHARPARQIPLDAPVWCVHATDDDTVPFAQSEAYVERARGVERKGRAGGGDRGPLRADRPRRRTAWTKTLAHLDGL